MVVDINDNLHVLLNKFIDPENKNLVNKNFTNVYFFQLLKGYLFNSFASFGTLDTQKKIWIL